LSGRDDVSNLRRATEPRGAEPRSRSRWHSRAHARFGGNWVERPNASVARQKSLTAAPDGLDLLWETVGRIKIGMLTSAAVDGLLVCRPMPPVEVDPSGWLGFLVAGDGALAQGVRRDPRVNLSYSDSDESVFVSIPVSFVQGTQQGKPYALSQTIALRNTVFQTTNATTACTVAAPCTPGTCLYNGPVCYPPAIQ
jgi:hypothetical protein